MPTAAVHVRIFPSLPHALLADGSVSCAKPAMLPKASWSRLYQSVIEPCGLVREECIAFLGTF